MKTHGAYKYRLTMTEEQTQLCRQFAGNNRFLWNQMLEFNFQRLATDMDLVSYEEMADILVSFKKMSDTAFLKLSPSQSLQQTLLNLEKALKNWKFGKKGSTKKGKTQFKSRNKDDDSFNFPQGFKIISDNEIALPKLGIVSFMNGRLSKKANKNRVRSFKGKTPKNVTISRSGNNWDISICWEQETYEDIHVHSDKIIGIDRNVVGHRDSNGVHYLPFVAPPWLVAKIYILARALSRKIKKSSNHKKAAKKLAKAQGKLARIARDYIEKITTTIAKNHGVVIMEKLLIKNMTASAKGTIEAPGKNVIQKSGLNKAILNQRFGLFRLRLEQKVVANGGIVVFVSAVNSSNECSCCGHVHSDNRKSQSVFVCTKCGHAENADTNAAMVIKSRGIAEADTLLNAKIQRLLSGDWILPKESRWKSGAGQVPKACGDSGVKAGMNTGI